MRRITQFVLTTIVFGLVSCGGKNQTLPMSTRISDAPESNLALRDSPIQYAQEFPSALPQDSVQPWEELGSYGKVITATGASSDFFEGPQTHLENGDTSTWNGALRMTSGAVGADDLSYAMYRIPLGGNEPGVVSVDANIRPMGDGTLGGYWIGLSDYGNGTWQWFGPVSDAHWRISAVQAAREAANYTSGVGSVFICVVAHDGAAIDVVGVGVDPVDAGDITAPDAPSGLVLTPVASGLEVNWIPVGGSDVAGYKVYYKDKAFTELTKQFANTVDGFQGRSFILDATAQTFVAVSAVDKSGNESTVSAVESATPLAGTVPVVTVDVSNYSVVRGEQVSLTATGAGTYDWDIDGDGTYDILDDASGSADVDTSQTGLIRPMVRGTGVDSTSVAMSAVSVIVSSNSRPVVQGFVEPAFGVAPLEVQFTSNQSDFDGEIVEYIWDFTSNGAVSWRYSTAGGAANPGTHIFNTPGLYNAKVRVWDDEGAWDVDTVTVHVWQTIPPSASISVDNAEFYLDALTGQGVTLDASGSFDPNGGALTHEFDPLGNGDWQDNGSDPVFLHTYQPGERGLHHAAVRVTNPEGATDTSYVVVNAFGFVPTTTPDANPYGRIRIVEHNDRPYLAWTDNFDADHKGTMIQGYDDPTGSILGYTDYFQIYKPAYSKNALGIAGSSDSDRINMVWYEDEYDELRIGSWRANNGGWSLSTLYAVPGKGETVDLETVEGNPAIIFYDSSTSNLFYRRSTATSALGPWDPEVIIDTGSFGTFSDLLVVDGRPAVLYTDDATDDVYYSIADDATGLTWAVPITVDSSANDIGQFCTLALINGNPAFVSRDSTDEVIRYSRSATADGAAESDWSTDAIIDLQDGLWILGVDLLEIDGLPVIVVSGYESNQHGRLSLITAENPEGSTWGDPLAIYESSSFLFNFMSAMVLDGHPAIAGSLDDIGVQLLYPRL